MIVTLADSRTLTLPKVQCGVIGRPGSGKTHFLASLEKPLLVLATDPFAKLQPYYEQGVLDPKRLTGQFGQPLRLVRSAKTNNVIIQIEGFYDTELGAPVAFNALQSRCSQLREEVRAGGWASVVLDSWSQAEYIARQHRSAGPFAVSNNDGRAIYAAAMDDLQGLLNARLVHLDCNLGISFHVSEKMNEASGTMIYGIKAIGQSPSNIASVLAERYHAVNVDGTNRQLRTRDVMFDCCTLIDAPDPCANDYKALFANWIAKQAAIPPPATPEVAAQAAPGEER